MIKELHFDEKANIWKGALTGELDVFEAPKLLEGMQRALSEHPAGVILDCGELTYVDSMGLGALVKLHKQVEAAGGTVVLTEVLPRIRKLFAITGLLGTFGMEEGNG